MLIGVNRPDTQGYWCCQWCTRLRAAFWIRAVFLPFQQSRCHANADNLDRKETSGAVPIPHAAVILPGPRLRSTSPKTLPGLTVLTSNRVNIINADNGTIVSTLPAENVFELGFSPLGTYIITWQRSTKDENGDATKNLKVWLVIDEKALAEGVEKETVARFVQKSQTGWNLQYTYDEKFCARVVTNEVQIYQSHDLTTVWNKIRVEGVTDFAISPGKSHTIAVFVPERKVSWAFLVSGSAS